MPLVIYMILDGCIVNIFIFFPPSDDLTKQVLWLSFWQFAVASKDKNIQSGLSVNHKAGFGFTKSVCFHEEHTQLSLIWLPLTYGVVWIKPGHLPVPGTS